MQVMAAMQAVDSTDILTTEPDFVAEGERLRRQHEVPARLLNHHTCVCVCVRVCVCVCVCCEGLGTQKRGLGEPTAQGSCTVGCISFAWSGLGASP